MRCVARPRAEKGMPDTSNEYSDEGTAAHHLGSECLEDGVDCSDYEGSVILVGHDSATGWDGAKWDSTTVPKTFATRRTYEAATLAKDVQVYVGAVRDRIAFYGLLGASVDARYEQRVNIDHITHEWGAQGTADVVLVVTYPDGSTLVEVGDLKFGRGVQVDAAKNKQLMVYASGAIRMLRDEWTPVGEVPPTVHRVSLVIYQPRLDPRPSEYEMDTAELDAFIEEARARADEALMMYRGNKPAEYSPGEDACRWCKALPTCTAATTAVIETVDAGFDLIDAKSEEVPKAIPRMPVTLGQKLRMVPFLELWCKQVRAEVGRALFAGENVPGYKLVEGKRGNRQWTDQVATEELFKRMRLTLPETHKIELRSPAHLEELLKPQPRRWQRVLDANLISQRPGGPSVAPLNDKRPEWKPSPADGEFTVEQS